MGPDDGTRRRAPNPNPNPDPNPDPNPNPNPNPNPANPSPSPNPNQGKLLHEFTLHTSAITALAIHPCEFLMASASADRTVRLWDLETFEPVCCTGLEIWLGLARTLTLTLTLP